MTDSLSKDQRSEVMRRIRSKDTCPEMQVRQALHASGFRYRLHDSKLPGKPDIVLPRHKAVVLVHGCFWHGHRCKFSHVPSSNVAYWTAKIARNQMRDKENVAALATLGWRVFVLWECELGSALPLALEALRAVR